MVVGCLRALQADIARIAAGIDIENRNAEGFFQSFSRGRIEQLRKGEDLAQAGNPDALGQAIEGQVLGHAREGDQVVRRLGQQRRYLAVGRGTQVQGGTWPGMKDRAAGVAPNWGRGRYRISPTDCR